MKALVIPVGYHAAYKVTDKTYVVYGPPTSTNTLGFCHVKVQSGNVASFHKCTCKGFVSKGKREKSRSLCVHLHVLFCCLELSSRPPSPSSSAPHCATRSSSTTTSPSSQHPEDGPSTSRISTLNVSASPNTQHPEDGPSTCTSRISTLNFVLTAEVTILLPTRSAKGLASYADILLARHALLPNERLLKQATINVDQLQCTSKAGKCVLCPLGKFARHAETNMMDDCVVFQRVPARDTSW